MANAEIGLIGLGVMGSNLALNIAEKGHRIAVYNRTTSKAEEFLAENPGKNIKVGKRPRRMAITPDGKELWVTNELDASVSIVATASHEVTATLKFEVKGARKEDITPVGITMTRDGKRAFVALGKANHVAFVDVAARKVTDQVLVGKRA